ncbi:flavodoxin family protein [Proteiniclasticum sp. C24MP]|uniref:flavodoxin family protein n=1 Tax=Proteiniclasticum sp. C24MP TaxID=3374101 RepID=UPI00375482F9
MKTAIIIHSLTGNTLSVGSGIKSELLKKGMEAELVKIEPIGGEDKNESDPKKIRFQEYARIDEYDYVILGCPVRGFSMSPVLKAYLTNAGDMKKTRVFVFVTHFFPFSFMGGRSAIRQLKNEVERKGGAVMDSAIIDWKNPSRDRQIDRLLEKWSKVIR